MEAKSGVWKDKGLPLQQEIIFASTGTKKPSDPPDKYVGGSAGSDIQTNPPATNEVVQKLDKTYARRKIRCLRRRCLRRSTKRSMQKKMERNPDAGRDYEVRGPAEGAVEIDP